MGLISTTYGPALFPSGSNQIQEYRDTRKPVLKSNEHLLFQIRRSPPSGGSEVITAFANKEDVKAFMTLIYHQDMQNGIPPHKVILSCGNDKWLYTIEHNSTETYVIL